VWFNYPVEKYTIRFYKYKFDGIEKEIVVEANNRLEARNKLIYILQNNPVLRKLRVVDESVTLPVIGVTTRNINNKEYVWMGKFAQGGWISKEEYEKFETQW
jgi:DNA-binding transcriptional regulator WhiA